MKASDYIVSFIQQHGVNVVYGYIGGMITHLVDSIARTQGMQFVQAYHEQSAAFAAEGYSIENGNLGVAISTSGPGATNMITGIADAWFGSIPVLYISGQVNSYEYKYDKPIRQQGFQETDIVSIVKPITKYAALVDDAKNLRYELEKAVYMAQSGRRGPVLLDICMDVQRTDINPNELRSFIPEEVTCERNYDISEIANKLSAAKRPMFLFGAGAQSEKSKVLVSKILGKTQIPAVCSLMGLGVVNADYEYYLGLLGSYGNRCANKSMKDVDLLIAVGSRLDTRQTGARFDSFVEHGTIIHVDIDNNELTSHRLNNRMMVCESAENFLEALLANLREMPDYTAWQEEVKALKTKYSQETEVDGYVNNKSPYRLMETINEYSKSCDVFVADIGHNQMIAAQTLKVDGNKKFVTSGGLAPMGFSLPISVGIAMSNPEKRVISINGDGGFHMASQSLMLISQYNLPVIAFIVNNESLGMITQFQTLYFNGRMNATTNGGGYKTPDFKQLAKAYGLKYYRIDESSLADKVMMSEIFAERNCVVDFWTNGLTTISPKLEYNKPIYQPTPDW